MSDKEDIWDKPIGKQITENAIIKRGSFRANKNQIDQFLKILEELAEDNEGENMKLLEPNSNAEVHTGFKPTGLHRWISYRRYYKEHYIKFLFRFPFPIEVIKTKEFMDKCVESLDKMIKEDIKNYTFEYESFSFEVRRYRMLEDNSLWSSISCPGDNAFEVLKLKGLYTKENLEKIEKDYQLSAEEEIAEYEAFKRMKEKSE